MTMEGRPEQPKRPEFSCPECHGTMIDTKVFKGYFEYTCLSCGHVWQKTYPYKAPDDPHKPYSTKDK